MTDRPIRAEAAQPIPSPVSGELVEPQAAVIPSATEQAQQADRAVGRTTQQVGLPVILVGLAVWGARLFGLDLNPLPGQEDMPADVAALWIGLATWLLARRMNPKP